MQARGKMNIRKLEVFSRVVELHSFTKAAEVTALTQPTVSEHIRDLEQHYNERLVDRKGHDIIPTEAGKILYRYSLDILQLFSESQQAIFKYSDILAGNLKIGASFTPGTYFLPGKAGMFRANHPEIKISLEILSSARISQKITDGELEFGIIGTDWNSPHLDGEKIFSDELVLAVYPGHPFAKQKSVSLGEIMKESLILLEKNSGTRKCINKILRTHGHKIQPQSVAAEMGSIEAVKRGVKSQLGLAILPKQAIVEDIETGSLAALTIRDANCRRSFYLVKRKNRNLSPLGNIFRQYLLSDDFKYHSNSLQ